MGTTPLLTKTLPRVSTEMSLAILAYNMKRVIKIVGMQRLMSAMAAWPAAYNEESRACP